MRAAWLVLLLLPPCTTALADMAGISAARTVIEQCKTRDKSGHGLAALRAACPGIDAAADALGVDALLPRDWRTRVDAYALADLAAAAERYAAPAAPHALPDAAQLRALARALQPQPMPASWWDRVAAWLRRWLTSSGTTWPAWLHLNWPWHWRWSPGVHLRATLLYVLAAAVVLGAVTVVVMEVRAARTAGTRAKPRSRRRLEDPAPADEAGTPLDAIQSAAAGQQPVLALRLLVGALTRSQRLARDRNLTCRELVTAARFDGPAQQAQFQALALLAERALYGAHQRTAPAGASADSGSGHMDLDGIRKLYSALLAPRHEARPAP